MEKEVLELGITAEQIRSRIYTIRGLQVMLDYDLAQLFQVETRILNQAVKRNIERFPERFCFQLTEKELTESKSQLVILNKGQGRGSLPDGDGVPDVPGFPKPCKTLQSDAAGHSKK